MPHCKLTSTPPRDHGDGTLSAVLLDRIPHDTHGLLLHVALPVGPEAEPVAGRFFMLRCVEDSLAARHSDWSNYRRYPLFVAGPPTPHSPSGGYRWELFAPAGGDQAAVAWLQSRPLDAHLNLMGPFGRIHNLPAQSRTLLVVSSPQSLPLLLPWVHTMLDQGGRVTLILYSSAEVPASLLSRLPIPVEIFPAPSTELLHHHLADLLRWADHCVICLPTHELPAIAALIRRRRFRLEPGFALAYARADLVCGFGACLACVVAKADGGHTRACLHGPFFPLEELTR